MTTTGRTVGTPHPWPGTSADPHAAEAAVLRLLRLKGRVGTIIVGTVLGSADAAHHILSSCVADGLRVPLGDAYCLTAQGLERAGQVIADERGRLSSARWPGRKDRFDALDREFKQLVADSQEQIDRAAAAAAPLASLHVGLTELIAELAEDTPRLASYRARFAAALAGVEGGDAAWLAHPLRDSHHTVWFELHQEILDLAGERRSS
ncbi:hypothetical protein [Streptomyces spectabilis]|uniref:Pyruvate,orthophosphate dikinase n=1 Tax=Streptomyces spectabilis TaxID=68270 RepID=A0A7W8EZY2_STRST|nr:hypothetical protein [Streptomyces spectabilis]MBB5109664.1 pyruvate,orthophosphate dikinase [Streptomyces spectabilis]GGV55145.1 hypothetical protein GCM10010245_87280 [Streptomyces spectabilis]